jgi:Phage integrase, N-terminal SAM-like domain
MVDMVISSSVQQVDNVEEQCTFNGWAMPTSRVESWTVLGHDYTPIEPIERYLAYLTDIERSPNTVKAYAHDLKDYWTFWSTVVWTGGRCGSRTSASTWPGYGFPRPAEMARWRCRLRSKRTSARRLSTGSCPRWPRSTSTRCATASMWVSC